MLVGRERQAFVDTPLALDGPGASWVVGTYLPTDSEIELNTSTTLEGGAEGLSAVSASITTGGARWPADGSFVNRFDRGQISVSVLAQIDSDPGTWAQMLLIPYENATWATPFFSFGIGNQSTQTNRLRWISVENTTHHTWSSTTFDGFWLFDGLPHIYTVTVSGQRLTAYRDGIAFGQDTMSAALDFNNATFDHFDRNVNVMQQSIENDDEGFIGKYFGGVIWEIELSKGEAYEQGKHFWHTWEADDDDVATSMDAAGSLVSPDKVAALVNSGLVQ